MSDHEEELKRNQENGFTVLEESIKALKSYINLFIEERQKFSQKTFEDLMKAVEKARSFSTVLSLTSSRNDVRTHFYLTC
jgi:hypothetical protein